MRLGWTILLVGLGLSLAGCSVSGVGGLAGGLVTTLLAGALLPGVGTTSAGCSTTPCLSPIEPELDAGPVDGQDDADPEDAVKLDPCLSADFIKLDPCLTADFGPCLSDVGPQDPDIGPCLGAPREPPDAGDEAWAPTAETERAVLAASDRRAATDKLIARGALPDDVAARLKQKLEGDS